jgi:hypothetical protein
MHSNRPAPDAVPGRAAGLARAGARRALALAWAAAAVVVAVGCDDDAPIFTTVPAGRAATAAVQVPVAPPATTGSSPSP